MRTVEFKSRKIARSCRRTEWSFFAVNGSLLRIFSHSTHQCEHTARSPSAAEERAKFDKCSMRRAPRWRPVIGGRKTFRSVSSEHCCHPHCELHGDRPCGPKAVSTPRSAHRSTGEKREIRGRHFQKSAFTKLTRPGEKGDRSVVGLNDGRELLYHHHF